jgi:hypothetical protein
MVLGEGLEKLLRSCVLLLETVQYSLVLKITKFCKSSLNFNAMLQALTIISNLLPWFGGLRLLPCLHKRKLQIHNIAVGRTGQYGNCRSFKSTFGNRVPLT